MAAEIKIPVGNAIELAHHSLFIQLANQGLSLLGGGQLGAVAEHIDARQGEGPILAQKVARRFGLPRKGGLFKDMAGEGEPMLFAPTAALGGKSGIEKIGAKIIIAVFDQGIAAVGLLPEKLGQTVEKILAVARLIFFLHKAGPGIKNGAVAMSGRDGMLPFAAGEGGLIGEDGGNGLIKFCPHRLFIGAIG